MHRIYVHQLFPSRAQQKKLLQQLEVCRHLYNYLLDLNIEVYRKDKVNLVNHCQCLLKYLKTHDLGIKNLEIVPSHVSQDVCDRLRIAFRGFFRRVKFEGENVGFPRFKGEDRYDSLGFDYMVCRVLFNNKVQLSKVGPVKFKQHRDIPKDVKFLSATIRHRAGRWFISFTYDIGEIKKVLSPAKNDIIGIDLGLNNYVMTSEGVVHDKPKFLRVKLKELKEKQQELDNCKKGIKKRCKVKKQLQKLHEKVGNQRHDFLHKLSRKLVNENNTICVEDLNVKGMMERDREREKEESKKEKIINTGRRRNTGDAGWNTFTFMLVYKAAEAGRQVVKVDPRYTTQRCSDCGFLVPKKQEDRVHLCPRCKLELDRDHNAARNILRLGRESLAAVGA